MDLNRLFGHSTISSKTHLCFIGFVNSKFTTSFFVYSKEGGYLLCLVNVDDMILMGNSAHVLLDIHLCVLDF